MSLIVEKRGAVGWIVFNQPAKRNAINGAMWRGIPKAMAQFDTDPEVLCVAFRGAGTEAFASGADISEFEEQRKDAASSRHYGAQTEAAYSAIRRCPKPTVAMVFGYCMGGAMALAMAADFRFAAAGSKFGIPAARLSIIYGLDPVHQLVDLVGPAYAKDILYSARTVEAEEALRIGFIQRLVPVAELEAYTYDYLKKVAANAPLSVRGTKAQVQAIFEGITDAHRENLRSLGITTFDSEDYKEGTRAFLEKRAPRFQGR